MANKKENHPKPEECAKELDRTIEGELTLADLTAVVGGKTAGPIYNGVSYAPLKSRFGAV